MDHCTRQQQIEHRNTAGTISCQELERMLCKLGLAAEGDDELVQRREGRRK